MSYMSYSSYMSYLALLLFAAAVGFLAWDLCYTLRDGISNGMFLFICWKGASLYIRKAMIALALAWIGGALLMARKADGFPALATVFFVAGFLIVKLLFHGYYSYKPHEHKVINDIDAAIIGGDDGPTKIFLLNGREIKPFRESVRRQVKALHDQRRYAKFPELNPEPIPESEFTLAEGLVDFVLESFEIDTEVLENNFSLTVTMTNKSGETLWFSMADFVFYEDNTVFLIGETEYPFTDATAPAQRHIAYDMFNERRALSPSEIPFPVRITYKNHSDRRVPCAVLEHKGEIKLWES